MKIWSLDVDFQEYESFKLVNEDKKYRNNFESKILSATKLGGELSGEEIELIDGVVKSDFPKFWTAFGTPMISEKAKKNLEKIISNDVELIPLKYNDIKYYLINILSVLDAVDNDKSIFRKLDSGLIVGLDSYELKPDVIKDHNIFKLYVNNRIKTTEVFVTNKFKNVVEETKLTGFKFDEIWSN